MSSLAGIRVLDLTRLLPGAFCTMLLADFGADVIKVEEPGRGDYMRDLGPRVRESSAAYLSVNRNKKSITLNLKHRRGREAFLRLAAGADVLVEGFRPGVMDRLGLGYAQLREVNRRLVYCSLTGYGQDGPYCHRAGHDINYLAVAGILSLSGRRDGPPVVPPVQLADIGGGSLFAALGIMLALHARQRTGEGQYVDVAMLDGAFSWLSMHLAEFLAGLRRPKRGWMPLSGGLACYNVYETADGQYMALGALEPKFWREFCAAAGRNDLAPRQFEPEQEPLMAEVGEIFRGRTRQEWEELLAGRDCCCEPVLTLAEACHHPQVVSRGLVVEIQDPREGPVRQAGIPLRLSATPGTVVAPPPALGEHTADVLAVAGYTRAEIEEMRAEGVV